MSSGLAFGAISRAAPRISQSEFRIAEQEDREEIERQFEEAGKQTKKKGDLFGTIGGILGAATLAIPGVNLLGAAMLAGLGAGAGKKHGIQEGIRKSGIDSFKPRFHKKEVRRAKSDIRASAQQQGLATAVTTALTVYQLGKAAPGLADFIKNIGVKSAGGVFAPTLPGIPQPAPPINPMGARFRSSYIPQLETNPLGFDGDFSGLEILQ